MEQHKHHEQLISGIAQQQKAILQDSNQAIYIYLDDVHKICNRKFSSMLGLKSPDEFAKVEDMLNEFVDPKSQQAVVNAYQNTVNHGAGSTLGLSSKCFPSCPVRLLHHSHQLLIIIPSLTLQ
jgi:hypothetical protein